MPGMKPGTWPGMEPEVCWGHETGLKHVPESCGFKTSSSSCSRRASPRAPFTPTMQSPTSSSGSSS
eukprot:1486710-Heterocapsa_arctica.AAC.1